MINIDRSITYLGRKRLMLGQRSYRTCVYSERILQVDPALDPRFGISQYSGLRWYAVGDGVLLKQESVDAETGLTTTLARRVVINGREL